MSQSKGTFNRAVKNAYMNLTKISNKTKNETITSSNDTITTPMPNDAVPGGVQEEFNVDDGDEDDVKNNNSWVDFNVIVVDWSVISSNANYFSVVELIEDLGFLLAEFVRSLHSTANLYFGDVNLIHKGPK